MVDSSSPASLTSISDWPRHRRWHRTSSPHLQPLQWSMVEPASWWRSSRTRPLLVHDAAEDVNSPSSTTDSMLLPHLQLSRKIPFCRLQLLVTDLFVNRMEVSAVVADLAEKDDFVQPIESSHVDENDRSFEDQENRSFLYITSFTTITSTLTTFSFSTTTNTVSLGNNFAADAALTCIPSGYFVC